MFFFETFLRSDSDALTDRLATTFAEEAGPYAEEIKTLISRKDYPALVNFTVDYGRFTDPLAVFACRQSLALFQKRDDLNIGVDKEQVALEKFLESERSCSETNERLRRHRLTGDNPWLDRVFYMAQRKISYILGDCPTFEQLQLCYGPGANTNCQTKTSARWKLSSKPACSSNMVSSIASLLAEVPAYLDVHDTRVREDSFVVDVDVVPGKLMFVPKNAKTHRSIMVEPSLNSLLQKGYGTWMKRRLLKAGINLYDQSLNKRRAREGSMYGRLATVDLSSASDTISYELVADLLPFEWFSALDSARTSNVTYRGEALPPLKKFSSMGNAFTFELESLIFYALTWSVCRLEGIPPDISVYGDDIICPVECIEMLEKTFSMCGFTVNRDKSYSEGVFRESCGADYWKGINVRPWYQKTTWSPASLASFHNFLVRECWSLAYPDAIETASGSIPEHLKLHGPDGYGDGHLISESATYRPYKRDRGWSGFVFETYVQRARRIKAKCIGDRVLPVYTVYMRMAEAESPDYFAVRGAVGEKRISVYTLGRF